MSPPIDSINDISERALVELKAWLEPWLREWGRARFEWDDVGLDCGDPIPEPEPAPEPPPEAAAPPEEAAG